MWTIFEVKTFKVKITQKSKIIILCFINFIWFLEDGYKSGTDFKKAGSATLKTQERKSRTLYCSVSGQNRRMATPLRI